MGFPKSRKLDTSEEYVWEFNVIEPLTPMGLKLHRRYFEDLNTHPSGEVVGISSVGTRELDNPSAQLDFSVRH